MSLQYKLKEASSDTCSHLLNRIQSIPVQMHRLSISAPDKMFACRDQFTKIMAKFLDGALFDTLLDPTASVSSTISQATNVSTLSSTFFRSSPPLLILLLLHVSHLDQGRTLLR